MTLWAAFATTPWLFMLAMGGLGLLVGSFLNVVIYRLPRMLERSWRAECAGLDASVTAGAEDAPFNLMVPRSRCPHCQTAIAAHHNIPVLSYLLLGGKCAHCRHAISRRYPIIEALSGALAVLAAHHYGFGASALGAALFSWALLALAAIDFDTQLLPDDITLPGLWLGLLLNINGVFTDLTSSVIGAAAGYLALWSIYWGFRLATGKEGMGYGDFKLLAMIGAWLGWQTLPIVILSSSVVGAVVGLSLIAFRQHDRAQPIPFGPYLAAAGWIGLLWGPQLSSALFAPSPPL